MNVKFPTPAGVTVFLAELDGQTGPYLRLDLIRVDEPLRRQGLGTRTMRELCEFADRRRLPLALSVGADFGVSKAALTRWYRSFGFVPNRGRHADLSISASMIRLPRS